MIGYLKKYGCNRIRIFSLKLSLQEMPQVYQGGGSGHAVDNPTCWVHTALGHYGKHAARCCSVDYLLVFRHAAGFDPFAVGLRVIERQFTASVRAFEVVNHQFLAVF